ALVAMATASAPGQMQCCECGTLIDPNPTALCLPCLRNRVDITEGLQRQCVLSVCPKCARILQPPNHWVTAEPESKELLALCLKRIRGLNKVRLVDAGFVWTEPHSRRLRVRVTVQAEVLNGAIAEQTCEIEFTLQSHQCDHCNRSAARDYWRALVQLRQHSPHPKTLLYLEQLVLKHQAHRDCTGVKRCGANGLDFFFAQRQDAKRLADFLAAHSPSRCQTSETLVSHDTHSNVFNYKYTFCIEVAPICKDDVVCLPPPVARKLSSVGQFCVVYRVTDRLHLVDPRTCRTAEVTGKQFWQAPFQALQAKLSDFTVTNCEPIEHQQHQQQHAAAGGGGSRFLSADVWLLTDADLSSDEVHCRSHLGRLLSCGDTARGLDLRRANLNHAELDRLVDSKVPDVVLVKKVYASSRRSQRRWRLRRLEEADVDVDDDDSGGQGGAAYQEFLDDLEEDKELRRGVNIYKERLAAAAASAAVSAGDDGAPEIGLDEMLDELNLDADDAAME
ncbi:hypothetical protein BOX15_Mlig027541g2, partial [Macrostomum lignano]